MYYGDKKIYCIHQNLIFHIHATLSIRRDWMNLFNQPIRFSTMRFSNLHLHITGTWRHDGRGMQGIEHPSITERTSKGRRRGGKHISIIILNREIPRIDISFLIKWIFNYLSDIYIFFFSQLLPSVTPIGVILIYYRLNSVKGSAIRAFFVILVHQVRDKRGGRSNCIQLSGVSGG